MAKKNPGADSAPAAPATPPPAAPPADAPAAPEALPEEFSKGGRFCYDSHPRCKGYVDRLSHRKAVYVDNDGREYLAYVTPLPINKGVIVDGPGVDNASDEMTKISLLPFEKQVEALADLNARMHQSAKFLLLNGTRTRLVNMDGVMLRTIPVQNERGVTTHVPVADLLVNFSRDPAVSDWRATSACMHQDYVPRTRKGENGSICFRLA